MSTTLTTGTIADDQRIAGIDYDTSRDIRTVWSAALRRTHTGLPNPVAARAVVEEIARGYPRVRLPLASDLDLLLGETQCAVECYAASLALFAAAERECAQLVGVHERKRAADELYRSLWRRGKRGEAAAAKRDREALEADCERHNRASRVADTGRLVAAFSSPTCVMVDAHIAAVNGAASVLWEWCDRAFIVVPCSVGGEHCQRPQSRPTLDAGHALVYLARRSDGVIDAAVTGPGAHPDTRHVRETIEVAIALRLGVRGELVGDAPRMSFRVRA
jgi:hypothetical protein